MSKHGCHQLGLIRNSEFGIEHGCHQLGHTDLASLLMIVFAPWSVKNRGV